MDLKELDLVDPSVHWYYQAKLVGIQAMISRHLGGGMKIVDVGAGSGFFSLAIADELSDTTVTCVDPHYPDETLREDGPIRFVRSLSDPSADLYLFIDVLEHVDDDLSLLREYVEAAPKGALVVISVPAFQSLWSGHDVFLEHKRRYRLKEVEDLAQEAGLRVEQSRYLFASVFPLAWLMRRIRRSREATSDMKAASPAVNQLLTRILKVEHRRIWNSWFGLSAVVVAEAARE